MFVVGNKNNDTHTQLCFRLGGTKGTKIRYIKAIRKFLFLYPEVKNLLTPSNDSIMSCMFDLWDAGYSHSEFVSLIMAIDAGCVAKGHDPVSSGGSVKLMLKRYQQRRVRRSFIV